MGSLQLEPASIFKPPITIRPSSPLHASDFEEEKYLAGGARGFYMSNANVEERIDHKEKVSSSRSVGYGDERKLESRRSSGGYGARPDGSLGHVRRQEKKASITSDGGERKEEEKKKKKKKREEGEVDYVHRGQWLRAAILGANDGLVSTASLMMGVGAVKEDDGKAMIISGLAGLVAGACSMAIGEFVSVYSQRDAETFDKFQKMGLPSHQTHHIHDLEEGKSPFPTSLLVRQPHFKDVSHGVTPNHDDDASLDVTRTDGTALHANYTHANTEEIPDDDSSLDVTRTDDTALRSNYTHANTEEIPNGSAISDKSKTQVGKQKKEKDVSVGPSPWEAAGASGLAFALGAMVPLLSASFIKHQVLRLGVMMGVCSGALMCMGAIAAKLSAGNVTKGGVRVLLGGWAAMFVTYGLLRLFGTSGM